MCTSSYLSFSIYNCGSSGYNNFHGHVFLRVVGRECALFVPDSDYCLLINIALLRKKERKTCKSDYL